MRTWARRPLRMTWAWCGATLIVLLVTTPGRAVVERYKNEAAFLARVTELGLNTISEGFESAAWDAVRSSYPVMNSLPSVTSQGLTWEAAALDLWNYPTSRVHGVTTNNNWARSGQWGVFEDHVGDPLPTTIRISSAIPLFGIGGWFDTNPDLQSVGFLLEERSVANEPGYLLEGYGAMYPGDNPSVGHEFAGIVDPDGFHSVVLTGTLEINEEQVLEGGVIFGADDLTFAVAANGVAGDFDGDGDVDGQDFLLWQRGESPAPLSSADLMDWQANYGTQAPIAVSAITIPEPSGAALALIFVASMYSCRRASA